MSSPKKSTSSNIKSIVPFPRTINSPTKSVSSNTKSIVSVGSSVSSGKLKGELICRIRDVNFHNVDDLRSHLAKAGIVKKPGTSLSDLQKSFLGTYNVKTLALFYQHLCPDSNVDEAKKGDLVSLILKVLIKGKPASKASHSFSQNIATVAVEVERKGSKGHSNIISPVKIDSNQESNSFVNFLVVKKSPGYSKSSNVLELVKAFSLKEVRRFSREAALHYLLLQCDSGFSILNYSVTEEKEQVKNQFLQGGHLCNSCLIGWDLFVSAHEAASVRNRLSPPQSLSGDGESSDGCTTCDDERDKEMNEKPAYTLWQDSEVESDIEPCSQSNSSLGHKNSSNSNECGNDEIFNLCSGDGDLVDHSKGKIPSDGRPLPENVIVGAKKSSLEESVEVKSSPVKVVSVAKVCNQPIRKVPKIGNFSYDRKKAQNLVNYQNNYRVDIVVSNALPSRDMTIKQVIVTLFFNKTSFKTQGLKIILESALESVEEDSETLEWIKDVRVVHKRKTPYGPNEEELVSNRFSKFELLQFPLKFPYGLDSESIRSAVDTSIEFFMNVLRSDDAVSTYTSYLMDMCKRLWDSLATNATNNRVTPEEYTKHFIQDFANNEPSVAFNVSLDHFLLDDDIRRIMNDLGYFTAADMIRAKFNGKTLYRDVEQTDVPSWMPNSNSSAVPYNIGN